jgi:peptide subunit release factor 1 (eRF1)
MSSPSTVRKGLAVEPPLTVQELRQLAQQRYDGPVISLYLNFTAKNLVGGERPIFLSVFHSLRHQELEARKAFIEAAGRNPRLRLQQDLQEIEAFLEELDPEGARSLALFKCGEQLNRVMRLPVRTTDSLMIDVDPFIEPLEKALEEQHRVLIVEVSKDEARFSVYLMGLEDPIEAVESFVPSEKVDAARPGKVQRHRQTHLQWHLEAVAQRAGKLFEGRGCDLVALIGDEPVLGELDTFLAKAIRPHVFARLPRVAGEDRGQRQARIEAALADRRKREERQVLADLGAYQAAGRLASGLPAVIEAANLVLIRRLFVSADLAPPGFVCPTHRYLALEPGSCPLGDEPLLAAENIVDELIEVARLHGAAVLVATDSKDLLAPYGGIVAVKLAAWPSEQA